MTPTDWAAVATGVVSVTAGGVGAVRWLVKHYLAELKPNGGESLKDKVRQLNEKVDLLTELVKEVIKK